MKTNGSGPILEVCTKENEAYVYPGVWTIRTHETKPSSNLAMSKGPVGVRCTQVKKVDLFSQAKPDRI